MENKELLREITYLSKLINSHPKGKTIGVNPQVFSKVNYGVTNKPVSQFTCNKSTRSLKPNAFARINPSFLKTENRRPPNPPCPSSFHVQNQPLHINRNIIFKPTAPKVDLNNCSGYSQPSCVYYNPHFKKSDQKSNSIPTGQVYDANSNVSIGAQTKIHVNPSFIQPQKVNHSPDQTKIKSDRVYINPNFINSNLQETSKPLSETTPNIPSTGVNMSPFAKPLKRSNSKEIISKHQIVRKRSFSLSKVLKQLPAKSVANINHNLNNSHWAKYKYVRKNSQETLKPQTKEKSIKMPIKKTKYSIVRSRGTPNSESTRNNKLKQMKNILNVAHKFGAQDKSFKALTSHKERHRTLSTNSVGNKKTVKIVGKRKIVKVSVLQSQIMARRISTNSSFVPRKIINNAHKMVPKGFEHDHHYFKSKYKLVRARTSRTGSKKCPKNSHTLRTGNMKNNQRKINIVNIGGILYRSSRNKLIKRNISKGMPPNVGTVRLGGATFRVGYHGKILRPINNSYSIKKVDIAGKSYNLANNQNYLRLNNTNTSKFRLMAAKQKSIAVLTAKLKKNNLPCLFFTRFGYCKRRDNGSCQKVHDPINITICKKFIKGLCTKDNCNLSHNLTMEKVPTCHHYLKECCFRDKCPYLHVKHSPTTPICLNFLKGYCFKGQTCSERHEYVCPELLEKGKCDKRKFCPYPHTLPWYIKNLNKRKAFPKTETSPAPVKLVSDKTQEDVPKVSNSRYFASSICPLDGEEEKKPEEPKDEAILIEDSDDEEPPLPKKTTLLPEYIPLESTSES